MTNDVRDYLRQGLPSTTGPLDLSSAMRVAGSRRRRNRLVATAVPVLLIVGALGVAGNSFSGSDRLTGSVATTPPSQDATPRDVEDVRALVRQAKPPNYVGGEITGNAGIMLFTSLDPPRNLSPEQAAALEAETSARLAREQGAVPPSQEPAGPDTDVSEEVQREAQRLSEQHAAAEAIAPTTIGVSVQILPSGEPGWTGDTLNGLGATALDGDSWGPAAFGGFVDRQPSYYQVLVQQGSVALNFVVEQPTDASIEDAKEWAAAALALLR
jgi:hypothetical protein